MFSWLQALRKPRKGTTVDVLAGRYAGKAGVVTAVHGDRYSVYMDECCQATLGSHELRRRGQG
jgi:hypothetical protein